MLGLDEVGRLKGETGDGEQQLRSRGNILRSRLGQGLLRRNHIKQIADTVTVGFMCCFVRLLRGGEKGSRGLLLPESGSHVGVRRPNLVSDLVAKRIDLRLGRLLVGVGLRDTILAARAVEEIPSQLELGGPYFALRIASGKKILLPVRARQSSIPLEAEGRKIRPISPA